MDFFYQTKVIKGTFGAYFFIEPTNYKRYVSFWDVRKRSKKDWNLFSQLPDSINQIIWHFKRQLECSEERWDNFLMSLTTPQYISFKSKTKGNAVYVKGYISFALQKFPAESRIFKKAEKQLFNY